VRHKKLRRVTAIFQKREEGKISKTSTAGEVALHFGLQEKKKTVPGKTDHGLIKEGLVVLSGDGMKPTSNKHG